MVKEFLIAGFVPASACALLTAAPAHADEATYLQQLLPYYVYLSPQEALAEGYKVCNVERSGGGSASAVNMVYRDLGVSMTVANDIVRAAAVYLGC